MIVKATSAPDDRRVRRTRRQLREALVALILERGWEQVSVLDVCEAADVGRSTFYTHFADKENLLLSAFDDLHRSLDALRGADAEPFAFVEALVTHAGDNADLYRAVAGRQTGQQMLWRFTDVVTSLVAADVARLELPSSTQSADVTRFVTGGLLQLLRGWLDARRPAPAVQLAQTVRRFALGVAGLR